MKDMLIQILTGYHEAQNKSFKANHLVKFLTKSVPEIITNTIKLDTDKYKVTGSAGKGRWAEVP